MTFLKEFSKELSGSELNVKEIHNDIFIVEDFVPQETIDACFAIINKTTESEWSSFYLENLKTFCMEKFNRDDVENLVAEGKFEITENWADKNLYIPDSLIAKTIIKRINDLIEKTDQSLALIGCHTIQRMYDGVELFSHTDVHTDPSIQYAAIFYLNDNYEGGQLFFENLNISLKPKAGSLVLFPGTEEFKHGVTVVNPGPTRYVLVGFIKTKDFYNKNKF